MIRWNEEECRTVQDDGMCIGECDMCYSDREWKENEMIDKKDLPNVVMARTENWRDPRPYVINAVTREMDNVLVVPRSAVTETNGVTYVNVMDEQGNVKACSFVAGGYDNTNYWIIEGLSEGMVVCLK